MMENIEIYVNKKTRKINLTKTKIGNDLENLQAKLVFKFEDEFVNGSARLEYEADYEKHYVLLDKEEETYTTPVKNFLTKAGQINMQLVIVEVEGEEGIPVFKSNGFFLNCGSSINANEEAPEEYEYWLDLIQEKIAEVENIDINATKEERTATITITKKDGTQQEVEILDGENGTDGQDAKINGYNTINIVAGDNITIEQEEDTLTISSEGGSGGGNVDDVLVNGESVVTDKIANVVVPTKTSDLTNNSNFVEDANYVHTDNNYTTNEKNKLANLENYNDEAIRGLISSETQNRTTADSELQNQIDAITSASDVVDVVGTYAELQAYDTTHLKTNDIVKVLSDSTHQDAITYYRWIIVEQVGSWNYVGSQGPFYTKSETDSAINNHHELPTGGTTGQVLKKTSGTDYAVEWGDAGGTKIYIIEQNKSDADNLATFNEWLVDYKQNKNLNNIKYVNSTFSIMSSLINVHSDTYNKYHFTFTYQDGVEGQINEKYYVVQYNNSTGVFTSITAKNTSHGYQPIYRYGQYAYYGKQALSTDNTDSYTPTSDYNPATKKYVDDSITSAITNAIEGEY